MIVIKTRFYSGIDHLAISPCGRWLVVYPNEDFVVDPIAESESCGLKCWPLPTPNQEPTPLQWLEHQPRRFEFLRTGELLLQEGWETRDSVAPLNCRSFPDGKILSQLFSGDRIVEFSAAPDGQTVIATVHTRTTVRHACWDRRTGEEATVKRTAFKRENVRLEFAVFHPAGALVAGCTSGSTKSRSGGFLGLWSFPEGKFLRSKRISQRLRYRSLVFSPDGRWLAGCTERASVVWDGESLKELCRPATELDFPARAEAGRLLNAFTPDGRFLALGCFDGTVRLYDTVTWTEARVYDWGKQLVGEEAHNRGEAAVTHVAFTPDGAMGIAAVGNNIVLWDME